MSSFSSEKNAIGICDRCGLTYKLAELKHESKNYKLSSIRVCTDCFDIQNPQGLSNLFNGSDGGSLRDPRPDTGEEASRTLDLDAWNSYFESSQSDTENVEPPEPMIGVSYYGSELPLYASDYIRILDSDGARLFQTVTSSSLSINAALANLDSSF